jgi:energy-coupling factor transporter ATP-binding protein EcfA2
LILRKTLIVQLKDAVTIILVTHDERVATRAHRIIHMKDGLMPRDNFGDWLVPPHDIQFFYTWDKKRLTDGTLLGTAFYYHDTRIMHRFTQILEKEEDGNQR